MVVPNCCPETSLTAHLKEGINKVFIRVKLESDRQRNFQWMPGARSHANEQFADLLPDCPVNTG